MLKAENIVTYSQYLVSLLITWVLVIILVLRYFQIQVLSHDRYSQKANSNRIRKVTKTAPRGLILDRDGHILVDNLPTYVLTAIPGELIHKETQFGNISSIIGLDSSIVAKNYKKFYRGRFNATRLAKDLTFRQISKLEENRLNLDGVYYEQFPERYFPSDIKASHILGYVKEVDKGVQSNLKNKNEYELGDLIGWNGLEQYYEPFLKGSRGTSFFEVDAYGRTVRQVNELEPHPPEPGQNIVTTLDYHIQYTLEEIMKNKKGVILVSIPAKGEILGAVSAPDFKPDLFTGLMLEDEWKSILHHPDKPLINRFIQGLYPPGSIIKTVTAKTMMENPEFDPKTALMCDGSYQFGDRLFGCWWTQGHGKMNLTDAILNSCDVYFYKTTHYYDLDVFGNSFRQFGFGDKTHIDIPGESIGNVPSIKSMNKRYGRYGWSRGALLNLSIGQGELLVTPMQVLKYINLLATKGNTANPHFVMTNDKGNDVTLQLDSDIWNQIHWDLRQVIVDENGTGKGAQPNVDQMIVYGKTGTAENPHGENHAWFVGWMDYIDAQYSIVVLLENAGSGGTKAAPVAREVFLAFEKKQMVSFE